MPVRLAPVADLQPRRAELDVEYGATIDMPFGGYTSGLVNPHERNHVDLLGQLDEMQRMDGHMRALYRLISLPFRNATFSLEPAEDGEKEAAFIDHMLTRPPYEGGMTTSFDYIRACAAKATVYGYAVFEEVYTVATVPDFGPAIVLRKMAPREARTVTFLVDEHGGFNGVKQSVPSRGSVVIPRDKVFFFTVDKEDHPFYGRSWFEPALFHFDKKKKLYYIAHIAAQFAAVPGRLGHLDQDTMTEPQKEKFRQALADFGFNTSMVVPKGVRVEPFQGGSGVGKELLDLINHHNIQASQSILAQFIDLSMGSSGGTGSRSLSQDFSGLFLMCLQTLLRSFAEHLNWHVFPKFIDWNFGSGKYPTLKFDPISDEMQDAMVEIFKAVSVAAQTTVSGDFLYELEKRMADKLGLPVDYELMDEEREAQAAAELQGGVDIMQTIQQVLNNPPEPEVIEVKPDPFGKGSPAAKLAERELALVQLAEAKRDSLGRFSAVGELGTGAGFSSRGQAEHKNLVADLQARLEALGFDLGLFGVDGLFGNVTAKATRAFQQQNGLPETGRMDLATYALLVEESPEVDAPEGDEIRGRNTRTRDAQGGTRRAPAGQPRDRAEAIRRLRALPSRGGTGEDDE